MSADEALVRDLAAKIGFEGPILVKLKTDTYPDTKHFSYQRFTVQGDLQSIELLLKKAQTDPAIRNELSIRDKVHNEVIFYSQVVPKIRPILERMNENNSTSHVLFIPDYYGHDMTEGNEWLAIEDVSTEYKALNDPENLDKEQLKASIQALAAFHSSSLIWKSAGYTEYRAAANLFRETEMRPPEGDTNASVEIKPEKMNVVLTAATKACVEHLMGPYTTSLEKICQAVTTDAPLWVSAEKSEPWSVITHGDCWAKNFLYRRESKSTKITGIALLDFKCSRAGSPVLDVTNFLLSSASLECLNDLRPFIEKHKTSMSPQIGAYRSHVHQFGPYGLVSALIHHYFCVRYPNLDEAEATRLIGNPDEVEMREARDSAKSPGKSPSPGLAGKDNPSVGRDKRVALVIKAAHDVRMI